MTEETDRNKTGLVRDDERWAAKPLSKLGCQIHAANEDVRRKLPLKTKHIP